MINEEPEFNWWVKGALRILDRIVSRMERRGVHAADTGQGGANKKFWLATHKFVIEVTKIVENALEIVCKICTDFWGNNIRK